MIAEEVDFTDDDVDVDETTELVDLTELDVDDLTLRLLEVLLFTTDDDCCCCCCCVEICCCCCCSTELTPCCCSTTLTEALFDSSCDACTRCSTRTPSASDTLASAILARVYSDSDMVEICLPSLVRSMLDYIEEMGGKGEKRERALTYRTMWRTSQLHGWLCAGSTFQRVGKEITTTTITTTTKVG